MDASTSFDHYTNRRDLLRGFLDEYVLLAEEQPALVEQLTFNAFVQFSFSFYRRARTAEHVGRLRDELQRMQPALPRQLAAF